MSATDAQRIKRPFLITFLFLLALSTVWNLALPRVSGPDENSHLIRAAAVARGELTGHGPSFTPVNQRRPMSRDLYLYLTVPKTYESAFLSPFCFLGQINRPAGCEPTFSSSWKSTQFSSYVARYPPVYYVMVGAPTLVLTSNVGSYAVRFLTSVWTDLLLAFAFALALRCLRSRFLSVGLLVALSPMVLYLSGIVNPSAIEVSSAICLSTTLVVICLRGPEPPPRYQTGWVAFSGAVLAFSRPTSPLWIVVAVVALSPLWLRGGFWRHLLRRRDFQVAVGIVVVAIALSGAWTIIEHATRTFTTPVPQGGVNVVVRGALGNADDYLQEAIGVFGLGVRVPEAVIFLWVALLGALGLVAYIHGDRHERRALALVALAVITLPTLTVAAAARSHGYIGFGRYFLPLYVSLPIVAGGIIRRAGAEPDRHATRLALVALGGAQVLAFWWCLHRYLVGNKGSLSPLATPPGVWSPPVPAAVLDLVYLVLIVAAGLALARELAVGPIRGNGRGRASAGGSPHDQDVLRPAGVPPTER